jgi:hypothetical protein
MLTFHKTPELGEIAVALDATSLPPDVTWVDALAPAPEEIDLEQQQRIFGCLSERFRLFDQHVCLLHGRRGFRRGIPLDLHQWG